METSAIDLFCGIGGLSYGLKQAGISVVVGVDVDNDCKYVFESNVGGEFLHRDIAKLRADEINKKYWSDNGKVKILVGCAPCQPFSTHSNKLKIHKNAKKWRLIRSFQKIINETNPDIVSMENVPNLANQKIFTDFVDFLKQKKYFVWYSYVYCPDYGIPQKRRRLVLLASKWGKIQLIPRTHSKENYKTLQQAIGTLTPVESGEICKSDPLHKTQRLIDINLRRIKASKPNGTWLDWDEELKLECHKKDTGSTYKSVYGRMSWTEPSSTITTQFYNYGTGRFGHPTQNRALTIREAAILQTFPSDYIFYEDEKDIRLNKLGAYIGNAVPVELGIAIGKTIKLHIKRHYGRKKGSIHLKARLKKSLSAQE